MAQPSFTRMGIIAAVVAVAVIGVGLYATGEWNADQPSAIANAAKQPSSEMPAAVALDPAVRTLAQVYETARGAAQAWRRDAQVTRLYATAIGRDGALDPQGSTVQVVFVSPEATQAGPPTMNAFRWALESGAARGVEIMQQPAPELRATPRSLCPLSALLGQDAPERVTVDMQLARPDGVKATIQAFSDVPEKWLVVADPDTCQVQLRSARTTTQEATSAATSSSGASRTTFDAALATKAVDAALARAAACGTADGGVTATVTVAFSGEGAVSSVDIQPKTFQSHPAFACLADKLKRIHVAPWQSGEARVVRRIPF